MLESGRIRIHELGFKADDRDRSVAAFEKFRRGVIWSMWDAGPSDRRALESLEPKAQIFNFLIEFAQVRITYRFRVAEVLRALSAVDVWRDAANADGEVYSAIRRLVSEWE